MRSSLNFAILFVAILCLAEASENRSLLHLTNETFVTTIESNQNVFVIFHKDNNRASQIFLQVFKNLVEEQNRNSSFFPQVLFCEIDLVSSIPLRTSQNITHLPLIRLYNQKANKTIEYDGGRSEEALRKWLGRQFKEAPPLVKEIKTLAEIEGIIQKKNIVMAYFGPRYSEFYEIFFNTAEKYSYYNYIFGFSVEIFNKFVGESYPNGRIMCFNSNDDENYTFEGNLTSKKSLKTFFEGCSVTSKFYMDFDTASKLFKGKEAFMLLVLNSSVNESQRALRVYKEAKIRMGNKILMTVFDSLHEDNRTFGFITHIFEITMEDASFVPILLIVDRETKPGITIKYKHFGGVYPESIDSFYENWKNKALRPIYKTLPKSYLDPDMGLVKCINYDMINETVMNEEYDVFMMVYSLDCEACKMFKKLLVKVAEKYKEISNLKFVMINGVENDIPDLEVVYVPSFYLFKRGKKDSPIFLEDHRDEEKIVEFLRENLGWQWKQNEL